MTDVVRVIPSDQWDELGAERESEREDAYSKRNNHTFAWKHPRKPVRLSYRRPYFL